MFYNLLKYVVFVLRWITIFIQIEENLFIQLYIY